MPDGDDWESERVEVIHGEARAVLEAQNETMAEIDDRAMKSVRSNAILIGLLLTVQRIAGPDVFDEGLLHFSLASLVCSTIFGITTYNESKLYVDPDGSYFERIGQTSGEDRWDEHLIEGFAGMILENTETIDWNARTLTLTQGALIVGLVTAVLATAI